MVQVTAEAVRSGDWWAVSVPEVPGVFTQARRLDQVPAAVVDAIRTMEEDPALAVEVDVRPTTPWDEQISEVEQARKTADRAAEQSKWAMEGMVKDLLGSGLTVRDAGRLLHVSPQRVSQIAAHGRHAARSKSKRIVNGRSRQSVDG